MIVFLVMQVDIMQGCIQIGQRLFRASYVIIISRQRTVCSRYLIPIIILLEQAQCFPCKRKRKAVQRQPLIINHPQHPRTVFRQDFPVLAEIQEFRQCLQGIRFKIDIPSFPAHHQAAGQIVQFASQQFFTGRSRIHISGTAHIHIIKPLCRITPDGIYIHRINRTERLVMLLQIIKINSGYDIEFRNGVTQA